MIERRATCRECGRPSHTVAGRTPPYPWRHAAPANPEPPVTWLRIAGMVAFALALVVVGLYAAPIVLIGLRGS